MKRWLTEPLVHFILIGALLFGVHAWLTARADADERTIRVTRADIDRLATLWTSQSGCAPSEEELRLLITDYVREEALVREARQLGLEAGDTIVRRRLAQKMGFLLADRADIGPPDDATLRDWFEANRALYDLPEQRGFSHIYLSPQKRGQAIDLDAAAIRAQVNQGQIDWQAAGDAFMLQRQVSGMSRAETLRLYGRDFTAAVFALEPDAGWSAPIGSAFGLHLVRLDRVQAAEAVSFNAVRESVLAGYLEDQRRVGNQQAVADLIESYVVVIEEPAQ